MTTTAANPNPLASVDLSETPFTWNTLVRIAGTDFVPRGYRNNPEAMLAGIYMGREIGLGPMQSLQMIDVIDGRPALSAELMNARIRRAGHSITILELSPTGATIRGRRADNGDEATFTFSEEHAKRAGLLGKQGGAWKSYPESMYLARSLSALARFLFPDVFAAAHAYTPTDLGAPDGDFPTPSELHDETVTALVDILDAEIVDDTPGGQSDITPDELDLEEQL